MQEQNPSTNQAADPDLSSLRSGDIPFKEQARIIHEINQIVARNRIQIRPDTFAFTARKRGSLIPLLINAGALLVLAAGVFSLLTIFNRQEQSLIRESATVLTTEAKLIQALREESEQRLSEKDRQIDQFRARLENLREQTEAARREIDAEIREQENELRAEMEAQLAAERQKLQGQGLSSASIDEQLRNLQQRVAAENESRLAAFRRQSEAELAEKESELAEVEEQIRQNLIQFQQERTVLQQQFERRENELRAQMEKQAAEAQSAQAEVADQLARLREQRQKEQLVFDQIASSYGAVQQEIAQERYDSALRDLNNLEAYLTQASISSLPSVRERVPTERFLIDSLRRLIDLQRARAPGAAAQLQQTPPGGSGSAEELNRLQAELDRARASLSQQSRELDRAGTALERRTRELDQARSTISRQSRQLARYEASQRTIGARRQEIGSLQQRYAAASGNGPSSRIPRQKVLELVDTKLQVRQVLSSDPVKSQHPELYGSMEEYFATYGAAQEQAGKEQALADAVAVVDDLLGAGAADLASIKHSYATAEGDAFAELLQKLEALLE